MKAAKNVQKSDHKNKFAVKLHSYLEIRQLHQFALRHDAARPLSPIPGARCTVAEVLQRSLEVPGGRVEPASALL